MSGNLEQKLRDLVEPMVQSFGLTLWGLRYRVGHSQAHLQIFVDSEQGVDAEVCGELTNALSPLLDSADLIDPAYILEVSSPGLDRILFTREQMANSVGQTVCVNLKLPSEGKRKVEGVLKAVSAAGELTILKSSSQTEQVVAWENISTARIVPDYSSLL